MSAPIPLPNQGGGGGNGMLIAGLVAACSCSSSIGGGIFAFLRMRVSLLSHMAIQSTYAVAVEMGILQKPCIH